MHVPFRFVAVPSSPSEFSCSIRCKRYLCPGADAFAMTLLGSSRSFRLMGLRGKVHARPSGSEHTQETLGMIPQVHAPTHLIAPRFLTRNCSQGG
eukprot:3203925-Amphidinium_carterae.1